MDAWRNSGATIDTVVVGKKGEKCSETEVWWRNVDEKRDAIWTVDLAQMNSHDCIERLQLGKQGVTH